MAGSSLIYCKIPHFLAFPLIPYQNNASPEIVIKWTSSNIKPIVISHRCVNCWWARMAYCPPLVCPASYASIKHPEVLSLLQVTTLVVQMQTSVSSSISQMEVSLAFFCSYMSVIPTLVICIAFGWITLKEKKTTCAITWFSAFTSNTKISMLNIGVSYVKQRSTHIIGAIMTLFPYPLTMLSYTVHCGLAIWFWGKVTFTLTALYFHPHCFDSSCHVCCNNWISPAQRSCCMLNKYMSVTNENRNNIKSLLILAYVNIVNFTVRMLCLLYNKG